MSQRNAFLAALAITAIVLAVTVGVIFAMPNSAQNTATEPIAQTAVIAEPLESPADTTALTAREQAFQAQIEQANRQLQEAYDQIAQLQAQNQEMLQRDGQYQWFLAESNRTIEQLNAQINESAQQSAFVFGHAEHEEHDDD